MSDLHVQTRLSLVIRGELASKSNSRRLVTIGGKPRFIKSAKALAFEQFALMHKVVSEGQAA